MNLDRLQLFLHIIDEGSVTAASRKVHLTQPAASRNLKLLEEDLGAPLFERAGRRMLLTDMGRALEPRARALLAEAQQIEREIARVAARSYFDLRVGTVDSVATFLLPHIIAPLRSAFPDLQIKLRTARTLTLLDRLAHDELDLAVIAWSGIPPGQRPQRVGPYTMRYWGRADRFGEIASMDTEDALTRFPIIEIESLSDQPTLIPDDARAFAVAGSLASVKALVMAGFGVGALLDFMLTPEESSRLVHAAVPHDPDCGVFVVASPGWTGNTREAIESVVVHALRDALA